MTNSSYLTRKTIADNTGTATISLYNPGLL